MKPNREMAGTTHLANYGTVVSVRGSVVDIRFDEWLPAIYSVLRAGEENQIVIEVLASTGCASRLEVESRLARPRLAIGILVDQVVMFMARRKNTLLVDI